MIVFCSPFWKNESEIESILRQLSEGSSRELTSKEKFLRIIFVGTVAGFSILMGFGSSLALARKKDPQFFAKGLLGDQNDNYMTGLTLANKALKRATIYSVTGVSILSLIVYNFVLPKKKHIQDKT